MNRTDILRIVYRAFAIIAMIYFAFSISMVFYLGNDNELTPFFGVSFLLCLPVIASFSFLASNPDEDPKYIILICCILFGGAFAYGFARGYIKVIFRHYIHQIF